MRQVQQENDISGDNETVISAGFGGFVLFERKHAMIDVVNACSKRWCILETGSDVWKVPRRLISER